MLALAIENSLIESSKGMIGTTGTKISRVMIGCPVHAGQHRGLSQ